MAFTTKEVIVGSGYAVSLPDSIDTWAAQYKDAHLQKVHDATQMDVVLPDDCLILTGPPRLTGLRNVSVTPVGFITSFSMQETRQVQPMKAIGSRRHVFTATNTPVTLSIERMLIDGPNLMKSLYLNWEDSSSGEPDGFHNSKYVEGDWFMNLEDDIYRIPFGLGLVYNNPHTLSKATGDLKAPGADYFEGCVVQSCSMALQQGQTVVMEQVQILCDRRIPFDAQFRK